MRKRLLGRVATALVGAVVLVSALPAAVTTTAAATTPDYCDPAQATGNALLRSGQQLKAGQSISDGSETLLMQADGNLVLRLSTPGHPDGPALWASNTWGNPDAYAVMQTDGNLVVYRRNGGALWNSGTWNHPGACTQLVGVSGYLQVIGAQNPSPLWDPHVGSCICTLPLSSSLWTSRSTLTRGTWLASRSVWLVLQQDGNMILYRKSDNAVLWNSGTATSNWWNGAQLQDDGNLVISTSGYGRPIEVQAATGTWGNPGAHAVVQDDGNFVIYRTDGTAAWSTGTWGRA